MKDKMRNLKPSTQLAPLPVVIVSCAQKDAKEPNLITVAWCGTVCSEPPMLSIAVRPQRYSHELITASREFVVNLVDTSLVNAADFCGVRSGRDVAKLKACGLIARTAAELSQAKALQESPLTLSCRVTQIIPLGSHDLFLARIVAVEARESLFDAQGRLALEKAGLVAFAHGQYQALGPVLGFFGFSVASAKVLRRRLPHLAKPAPKSDRKNKRASKNPPQ